MDRKLKILFLCTGNTCRSQMAEGFARQLKGDQIEAHSAGTDPGTLDQHAVEVMREAGIDISKHRTKHVRDLMDISFDFIITLCDSAREACPTFPGKTHVINLAFDDPPVLAQGTASVGEALVHYKRVRDEIRAFVENLPEGLN